MQYDVTWTASNTFMVEITMQPHDHMAHSEIKLRGEVANADMSTEYTNPDYMRLISKSAQR